MPTLCEIIGVKDYKSRYGRRDGKPEYFDGLSFVPELSGNAQPRHDFLYWEFDETDQMALRMGDMKLIVKGGVPYLYDLSSDIHEDHDIAAQHPDLVRRMVDILLREHTQSPYFNVTLPAE